MGDGKTRENIMQMADDRGLSPYIVFTGSIQNVPDMLQAMDLMLLPSLHEGLPLVAVEWQMMGLSCALSDRITKECAFTDTVKFLPIDSAEIWKNFILDSKNISNNRVSASEKAITTAKEIGYDLQENAQKLQQYFERGDKQ